MLEGRQPLAKALVLAKLDRLSRSLVDFASIMERARKKGSSLATLDLGVDTTTPAGEMIANVMATLAQFAHGSRSCSRATSSCSERGTSASQSVNADGTLTTVAGNATNAVSVEQHSPGEATGFVRL
jgi:hypothetical protein